MNRLSPALRIVMAAGILAGGAACSSLAGGPLPGTVEEALTEATIALSKHDVGRLERLLRHAETLDGPADKEAEVQRLLAVVDWKYRARFDAARKRLTRATEGAEPDEAWIALARMESSRGDHAAAVAAARRGLALDDSSFRQVEALATYGRAAVGQAVQARRAGTALANTDDLVDAFTRLQVFVQEEPGYLKPSRRLLQAALLLDRGEAALLAWRSYFHVAPGTPAPNAIADAGNGLARLLPAWDGNASEETQTALVRALTDSRLFLEAMIVARRPGTVDAALDDPEVRGILAYERALRGVEEVTREHYRLMLFGKEDDGRWKKELTRHWREAVKALPDGRAAGLSRNELERRLDREFGAHINIGTTAGYLDLHMGHRVIDETRDIEQYGKSAKLRYVALDNMISNGFQSWAWEGDHQHGGWAEPDGFWQVRPAYADGALTIWRAMHDPEEREEYESNMARESKRDDDRARRDPHGFLPGLSMRLNYQAVLSLHDDLRESGLEGRALKLAFLDTMESSIQESSIYAHEGRHSIDTETRVVWRKEYHAKLSEVAFAPQPRLALGGIFSSSIGSDTPHGRANTQLMGELADWMESHDDEIAGFDPSRPLLPQFDRLTDDQIRAAFRSLDPLARNAPEVRASP